MNFKKILMTGAIVAATTFTSIENAQAQITFSDLPNHHWAYKAIIELANKNIVFGYGDGNFGLGDEVTREQVAALMFRHFKPAEKEYYHNPYKDVSNHSTIFKKEILALTEMGIFAGDEKGMFRPKDSLTREEMAQILTRAFQLDVRSEHTFSDVDRKSWANDAISAVQSNRITNGTGNGMYAPKMHVSREQYVQFLYNATLPFEKRPVANPVVKPETKPNRFANCKEANAAGIYDITKESPYYGKHLDRDGDGIACERKKAGK
ncbi:S-layer homology domain-containing protein [Bacillus cytotoxicus]|uniref:S-layer homology domain-containing protein n=1 Tax=Bacillus cytotoxicus TaxID=580165 RepID=UPI002449F9BF|nr:S-layer homology domain-containing protein [Bacillus cytotoxicus]MDH2881205.1 S-layer homology domain-containing protein [Bacillus cytotoxicus]